MLSAIECQYTELSGKNAVNTTITILVLASIVNATNCSVVELPKEAKSSKVTVAVTAFLPDYSAIGTTTLSIMTLSIMTPSLMTLIKTTDKM